MSFILICYNQVNEIDQALASVFTQKLNFSYEVIVSDDGSDDGTIEKIRQWQQKYPRQLKLLVHPRTEGQKYYALERITQSLICALKAMSGAYFCMLDGDDYYINDYFAAQAVEVMESNSHVNSVVFDFEYRFKDSTKKASVGDFREGIVKNKNRFVRKFYIHSGAYVFRNTLSSPGVDNILSCPLLIDNVIVPFFIQYGALYYIPKTSYSYKSYGGLWNSAIEEEKAMLTLMVAVTVENTAPQFKWDTLARGKEHLSCLYKRRGTLKKALNKNTFDYCQKIAQHHKNRFLLNLLNWEKANFAERLYTMAYFFLIKTRCYFEKNILKIFSK